MKVKLDDKFSLRGIDKEKYKRQIQSLNQFNKIYENMERRFNKMFGDNEKLRLERTVRTLEGQLKNFKNENEHLKRQLELEKIKEKIDFYGTGSPNLGNLENGKITHIQYLEGYKDGVKDSLKLRGEDN